MPCQGLIGVGWEARPALFNGVFQADKNNKWDKKWDEVRVCVYNGG